MTLRKWTYARAVFEASVGVVSVGILVVGCGSASAPGNGSKVSGESLSSSTGKPTMSGTDGSGTGEPDLTGKTVRIVVGGLPIADQVNTFLMTKFLKSWGADSKLINQKGNPDAVRAIKAGAAEVATIDPAGAVSSDTVMFGPIEAGVDYFLMGVSSLSNVKDLPGHVYGTSNIHGIEALMFAEVLSRYGLSADDIKVRIAGSSGQRVAAMLSGSIDATFVHSDQVAKLKEEGFNVLVDMTALGSNVVHSVAVADRNWLDANPDLASAVDLAWIKAAAVFHNDQKEWLEAGKEYTGLSEKELVEAHSLLDAAKMFPLDKGAFSDTAMKDQVDTSIKVGLIEQAPSSDTWLDLRYWNTAWTQSGLA